MWVALTNDILSFKQLGSDILDEKGALSGGMSCIVMLQIYFKGVEQIKRMDKIKG